MWLLSLQPANAWPPRISLWPQCPQTPWKCFLPCGHCHTINTSMILTINSFLPLLKLYKQWVLHVLQSSPDLSRELQTALPSKLFHWWSSPISVNGSSIPPAAQATTLQSALTPLSLTKPNKSWIWWLLTPPWLSPWSRGCQTTLANFTSQWLSGNTWRHFQLSQCRRYYWHLVGRGHGCC